MHCNLAFRNGLAYPVFRVGNLAYRLPAPRSNLETLPHWDGRALLS